MPSKKIPAQRSAAKPARSHELRIIGGDWKRSKLKVLDKPGLRLDAETGCARRCSIGWGKNWMVGAAIERVCRNRCVRF
jgi:hypothetical protein